MADIASFLRVAAQLRNTCGYMPRATRVLAECLGIGGISGVGVPPNNKPININMTPYVQLVSMSGSPYSTLDIDFETFGQMYERVKAKVNAEHGTRMFVGKKEIQTDADVRRLAQVIRTRVLTEAA